MDFGFASIPAIVVVCYLIGMIVKAVKIDSKFIPVICGIAGGILGIAGKMITPEFPASDYVTAAAVGIVSGLAATGTDQVYKQLSSKE